MCIFMAGNLSDGYVAFGPFDSMESAFEWADKKGLSGWAMTLDKPEWK